LAPASRNRRDDFDPLIKEASQKFGVRENLIRAVIKAESDFDPEAESSSGAVGLMQLLPSTAREVGVNDLYDPSENITGGTRYLSGLIDRYSGNLEMALAAYNWGLGNLARSPNRLPQETQDYVQRVLNYMESPSG
jgi:soluble lytic murein transglycosylase-like protein